MLNRLPPRLSPRFSVPYLAVLSGIWLAPSAVYADDASYSLSLNAGVAPRYQGGKQYTVTAGPGFRADFGNGWFIDPTQGGAGYAIRFLNGMFASAALRPIKPYPQQVESGGHSGHITAVGDRFVVFYSDGWVNGGGVDNLGSGNGVYVKVYDGRGRRLHDINVADERREWWPMIAGGTTRALLAWQQFVPGQSEANLKIAILDPVSGRVTGEQLLHKHLQYYTYSVTWLPAVERFLLVGVAKGNGFADLIDSEGKVRASISCMPATVREAGIAVSDRTAYTPAADGRLLQFEVGPDSLALSGTLMNADGKPVQWRPVGSVGLLRTSGSLDWLSLTERGLAQLRFDPTKAQPANATDQCR